MTVVESLKELERSQPSVVTIGNFDGLHRGHAEVLRRTLERSRALRMRSVAVTFDPHPVRFLAPQRAPKLISTLAQRTRFLAASGVDVMLLLRFDLALSRLTAEQFIRQVLVDGLRARCVCVGSNFNFGYNQGGRVHTLRQYADQFEILETLPVRFRGETVSSTGIRALIASGVIGRANRLLGHFFEIEGRIVRGAGRGRSLTVPTLNLEPENELIPKIGVYTTRISIDGGPILDAVTNVGIRPTFGDGEQAVETHVLSGTLPARTDRARLQFMERLREERKFDSVAALRQQIDVDIRHAERFFRLLRVLSHAESHSS